MCEFQPLNKKEWTPIIFQLFQMFLQKCQMLRISQFVIKLSVATSSSILTVLDTFTANKEIKYFSGLTGMLFCIEMESTLGEKYYVLQNRE